MEKIVGLIDAPFTPFDQQGEVNLAPIEAYARMLVKNGLKGVFINGSSGEGYMLTEEERMRLAEEWVRVAPAGFKVIVHVGSCCVKESKRLAEHAQKIGAWGIGAMAPPFPKIGRIEELVKYCEEIAAGAPQLPFYYYHIPAFNGAYLPMTSFLEAVDGRIPNFAGIKYTYESIYEYNQCRLYKNSKYDMLHGQDETILPSLAMGGAQGGIGGTTNYNGINLDPGLLSWFPYPAGPGPKGIRIVQMMQHYVVMYANVGERSKSDRDAVWRAMQAVVDEKSRDYEISGKVLAGMARFVAPEDLRRLGYEEYIRDIPQALQRIFAGLDDGSIGSRTEPWSGFWYLMDKAYARYLETGEVPDLKGQ